MTITDSIDHPTRLVLATEADPTAHPAAILARIAAEGRPTWCSHPILELIIAAMRAADRTELVHYAGASHRDDIAWCVAQAWLADPEQPESVLKSRALAIAAPAFALTPEQIRAANPGMR